MGRGGRAVMFGSYNGESYRGNEHRGQPEGVRVISDVTNSDIDVPRSRKLLGLKHM